MKNNNQKPTTNQPELYEFAEKEPEITANDFLIEICAAMDLFFNGEIRLIKDPDERSILYRLPNGQLFRVVAGRVE